MKQRLAKGEQDLSIVGGKIMVKKHPGGIQLKCHANEFDINNEVTPKKVRGFCHQWNYRDVGKIRYQ